MNRTRHPEQIALVLAASANDVATELEMTRPMARRCRRDRPQPMVQHATFIPTGGQGRFA